MRWKRVELDAQYPALCPLMLEVETVMGEEQVGCLLNFKFKCVNCFLRVKGNEKVLLAKVRAPFNKGFAGGRRPVVIKESHEMCPSCKGKVRFLCSCPKLTSQLKRAPNRNDASNGGPQNLKSSKVSGGANSEQDICIPVIYVKVATLDLNL